MSTWWCGCVMVWVCGALCDGVCDFVGYAVDVVVWV